MDRREKSTQVQGRIEFGSVENLHSNLQPFVSRLAPQASAVLPLLPEISAVEVQGNLPSDTSSHTRLRVSIESRKGETYNFEIGLDSTRDPVGVEFSLTDFEIPLKQFSAFLPDPWAGLAALSTCVVHRLEASGPLGEWKLWNFSTAAKVGIGHWVLPEEKGLVRELGLDLEIGGGWPLLKGTVTGQVGSLQLTALPASVDGIFSDKTNFNVDLVSRDVDVSGDWSVANAPGGAYRGHYSYSTREGYRVEATNSSIRSKDLGIDLAGEWSASVRAVGTAASPLFPSLTLSLRGQGFRYEQYDFSSFPIDLEMEATRLSNERLKVDRGRLTWGPNILMNVFDLEVGKDGVDAKTVELAGDLTALQNLLLPGKSEMIWRNLVPAKGWMLRTGIHLDLQPALTAQTENAQLDLGGGQVVGFNFGLASQTGQWHFNTTPLSLDLFHLLRNLSVTQVEADGIVKLQAELSGNTKVEGGLANSLIANIRGEINRSDGQVPHQAGTGQTEQYRFGWRQLSGTFVATITPQIKDLSAQAVVQDWGWTSGGAGISSIPGASRLTVGVAQENSGAYRIREFSFVEGTGEKIRLDVNGILENKGEGWQPSLDLRFQTNGSPEVSLTPSLKIEGTGVIEAAIRPKSGGTLILDGKLAGSDFDIRVPSRPVLVENLTGSIPIQNVHLDEYIHKERWNLREHPLPIEPLEPDVVDQAFALSGSQTPNVRMDRILVDDEDYRNVVGRVLMNDHILYLNSFTGLLAEGDYLLKGTGYIFIRPGVGSGLRMRGYSSKVPLSVAVPGLGNLGVNHDALKIDWYNYREPGEIKIETRHLYFDIPIGKLFKSIPLLGEVLFGWTTDSLNAHEMTIQRRKGGKYRVLDEGETGEVPRLPVFSKTDENFVSPIGE